MTTISCLECRNLMTTSPNTFECYISGQPISYPDLYPICDYAILPAPEDTMATTFVPTAACFVSFGPHPYRRYSPVEAEYTVDEFDIVEIVRLHDGTWVYAEDGSPYEGDYGPTPDATPGDPSFPSDALYPDADPHTANTDHEMHTCHHCLYHTPINPDDINAGLCLKLKIAIQDPHADQSDCPYAPNPDPDASKNVPF